MSNNTPRLRELQNWFYHYVVSPYGVEDAKQSVGNENPESLPLQGWITANTEEQAVLRLDVYANMYFFRLMGIFQDQFNALFHVLGERSFQLMCIDYLKAHPPTTYSLDDAKDEIPSFLKEHTPPDQPPWLYELAVLENARKNMIVAPDSDFLKPEDLQGIPPEQWGSIRFSLRPSHALFHFFYPVYKVWRAVENEEPIPNIEEEPCDILLWRHDLTVHHRVISAKEAAAVRMLEEGCSFEEICLSFIDSPDDENLDEAALQQSIQEAYQTLAAWVQRGMLLPLQ